MKMETEIGCVYKPRSRVCLQAKDVSTSQGWQGPPAVGEKHGTGSPVEPPVGINPLTP